VDRKDIESGRQDDSELTGKEERRIKTRHNTVHIQFGGFSVLIKFRFQYLHLSRGTDFNLVALSASRP